MPCDTSSLSFVVLKYPMKSSKFIKNILSKKHKSNFLKVYKTKKLCCILDLGHIWQFSGFILGSEMTIYGVGIEP